MRLLVFLAGSWQFHPHVSTSEERKHIVSTKNQPDLIIHWYFTKQWIYTEMYNMDIFTESKTYLHMHSFRNVKIFSNPLVFIIYFIYITIYTYFCIVISYCFIDFFYLLPDISQKGVKIR